MARNLFIAGDWGTSRLRLFLCDGGEVIDHQVGPGALGAVASHGAILSSLIKRWGIDHGPMPVVLCGMVGSRNGWVEAPYAACPADAASLRGLLVHFQAEGCPITIVPGVRGESPRGAPDLMRGEETQIVGALAMIPELAVGRRLFVLPGTHTKWVVVEEGRIMRFQTAVTGEMFALLRDHASLAKVGEDDGAGQQGGFVRGLERGECSGDAGLLHTLFEIRSRQLIDGWSAGYALDVLSGLLIGADVAGGLTQFTNVGGPVTLIGDRRLTDLYGSALGRLGVETQSLRGEDCALAGLRVIVPIQGASSYVAS